MSISITEVTKIYNYDTEEGVELDQDQIEAGFLSIAVAWVGGEEIQQSTNGSNWITVNDDPAFNTRMKYRIKPDAPKPLEVWQNPVTKDFFAISDNGKLAVDIKTHRSSPVENIGLSHKVANTLQQHYAKILPNTPLSLIHI